MRLMTSLRTPLPTAKAANAQEMAPITLIAADKCNEGTDNRLWFRNRLSISEPATNQNENTPRSLMGISNFGTGGTPNHSPTCPENPGRILGPFSVTAINSAGGP